ncbi:MAG: extracellular solute-binding protein [Lachnospiraceae bacterium]|nr:extracellular solute-binding protein [Lachnospiraceae bacterium]
MIRKKLIALCLVFTMVTALAGCGGKSAKSPLSAKNPVTIEVWNYYNGDQLTAFDNLVKEFNETVGKEKGIIVKGSSQGSVNDLETNVLAAIRGEVGAAEVPNIFMAYADTAYTADQMGGIVDLKPYLTEEEIALYIESYIKEGDFSGEGQIKIFPMAKSTEILVLNKTDWDVFAAETGAKYEDIATMEGLVKTAQSYYEWTDAKTPDIDADGKALFGRDAMANYMLIGSMQLGTEIFQVSDGKMTLNYDKTTVKKLWDNYYIPFVKGYFAATGRFRSDDIKTGNIIAYVGSSSSASFFPDIVSLNDQESYPIEMDALPSPGFANGEAYTVQQGAGMIVTEGSEAEIYASVEFLKWFTADEQNILFSVQSGYMPVTKTANNKTAILNSGAEISLKMEKTLPVAVDMVNEHRPYTTKAFEDGTKARNILEYSMSDRAAEDRAIVVERLASGQSFDDAVAEFCTDDYFDAWYAETLEQLQAFEGK